jgi:hypothetical protein
VGWTDLAYKVMDAHSELWSYFFSLTFLLGAWFLIGIIIAVLGASYEGQHAQQRAEAEYRRAASAGRAKAHAAVHALQVAGLQQAGGGGRQVGGGLQVTRRLAEAQGGEGGEGGEGGKRRLRRLLATAKGAAMGVSAHWQLALAPGAAARRDLALGEARGGGGGEGGGGAGQAGDGPTRSGERHALGRLPGKAEAAEAAADAADTPLARLRGKAQQVRVRVRASVRPRARVRVRVRVRVG